MRRKTTYIVLVLLILGIIYFIIFKDSKNTEFYEHQDIIDSLENTIDSLKNSNDYLYSEIDSSQNNIKIIEHWYEKEYNTVLIQSTDSDCIFFREYLSQDTK